MKTKITILIAITFFTCLIGYITLRALEGQRDRYQSQQQKIIERNPDLAKFFKS